MMNIRITRYAAPMANATEKTPGTDWQGHVEPDDRSWIAFIGRDGRPVVFLNRDPSTGAVLD